MTRPSPLPPSPLLSVRELSVSFGVRGSPVVDGVSFDIEPGECLGLVGESGSGKSVTARALLGLAGAGSRVTAAALSFGGTDLARASARRLRGLRGNEIGYVPQAALVGLDPLRPVGREIADALRLHTRMPVRERSSRVVELLAAAGVPEPEARAAERPWQLSGGLRQRALIASALALRPRLLIADEPTTALDTTVQAGILNLLDELRASGTAILLISHDVAVVSRLASRVAVMQGGRIVEQGSTSEVLDAPQHPYTRQLLAAVPGASPRGIRLTGEPTREAPAREAPAREAPAREQGDRGAVLLQARRLRQTYGARVAVDDVSLELRAGQTLGVVGESGSGKTTVARLVLALERPDAGTVELLGAPWNSAGGVAERQRSGRRPLLGAIYQDALSSFDPRLTVGQILSDALTAGRSRRTSVAELLRQVGLDPTVAAQRPRFLSGGQQQRVAIARAIAPNPRILVCDEPVSSLDASVQATILDLLDDLQQRLGLAYLFITHDLGVVRHASDEVIVMKAGRVVERGQTEQVFTQPQQEYTRALLAAAPALPRTSLPGTALPRT